MSKVNAMDLIGSDPAEAGGNSQVKVSITPVVGTGPTQLGMFDISVSPIKSSDQLINVQFIVQYAGQAQQAFTAFIFLEEQPAGTGYAATPMFCGTDAVVQNRAGKALTVMVVGGVNSAADPFFVAVPFSNNLWPQS